MAVLMEVKVLQQYDSQSCITTFHYLGSGTPAAVTQSFGIVAAMGFIDGIIPDVPDIFENWREVVSSGLVITEVTAKVVYSVTDFYTLPLATGNAGNRGTEPKPSFEAYAFQTSRVRADIRRGNRRLVGVTAEGVGDYGDLSGIMQGYCDVLATNFGDILTYDDEGNTLSYAPVVVSKEPYITPSGATAYKYYDTEIEQADHLASGVLWIAKTNTTTQVSRKRGRGV